MKKIKLFYMLTVLVVIFSADGFCATQPNADALLQMGHQKKHSGDLNGAIEFYKKALIVDPNFEPAKLSLEDALSEQKLILFSKNFPAQCQATTKDFDQTLECAQKYFVMNGRPINPMIIKDFGSWISDSGDQVVEINLLDSQTSNKYFCSHYEAQKQGKYFSVEVFPASKEEYSFRYHIEGMTSNGIFVLQTSQWGGGGTMVDNRLLFVRILKGVGFGDVENDKLSLNHKRILIEKLGEFPLGDRVYATVKIEGNTLFIETQNPRFPKENSTKKITLSLENILF